jgi:hypothetical protein
MFKANTQNLKVLTPEGFKHFDGIQKIIKKAVKVTFTDEKFIECSESHPFCMDLFNFKFKKAQDLKMGDVLFGHDENKVVKYVEKIGKKELYDLINVEDVRCYYTSGILSHNCEFINSGTSSIDETLYKKLIGQTQEPIEILMDGKYKLWDSPSPDKIYVAGIDTGEGVGGDYSCIKILDITDLTDIVEVAEFYDNMIPVSDFANKCYEILSHWGRPIASIERNNQGGQVADRLGIDLAYEKLLCWGGKLAGRKNQQLLGMISSRNTKYYACANARYYYNDREAVRFNNDASIDELFKDFVKVNDTWQAISGKHDDRTMALIWALMILDKDLCEQYFAIEEFDSCGKPAKISPLNFGIKLFENPTSIYTNEQVDRIENSNLSPMSFGSFTEATNEVSALLMDGWKFVGSSYQDNPDLHLTQAQLDSFDKYFG